ncbi:MAG: hypothetical protein OXC09_00200 [Truepera sp.]|nr:hypothetical protein [Truepera sp.]
MRGLIVRAVPGLIDIGIAVVMIGSIVGGALGIREPLGDVGILLGALLGLVTGFFLCIFYFGPICILLDIRDQVMANKHPVGANRPRMEYDE